ncbi:MAG: DUF423 domain-containing protein [Gammaproteobacteria bacterium]|jgi:uncharacterized membrane protein YgdD (TMEM256/DUF423 family)
MSTESKLFIVAGCFFLATAGALAAFGFHGPEDILTPEKRQSWSWAVDMQYYHGGGLVLVAILMQQCGSSWFIRGAGILMVAGILIFSGLVYAETLGMPESIGEIVPTGGSMLMLSWVLLAIGVLRAKP